MSRLSPANLALMQRGELNIRVSAEEILPLVRGAHLESDRYILGVVRCRMCHHAHESAWPEGFMCEEMQQCPECQHKTCEPVSERTIG